MENMQNSNYEKHGWKPLRIAGIVMLALLSVFLLAETVSVLEGLNKPTNPTINTITVSGVGKAYATPDTATVSYTVKKTAPTVAGAMSAATKTGNAALSFLRGVGINKTNIRTTNYSINPHRVYTPCILSVCKPSKITGYDVTQTVSIKIRDIAKVSTIISGLGNVGITNLRGPNFIVDDTTSVKNEARAAAISKARAQAETIAKQLGVHLVRITHYTETSNTPNPILYGLNVRSATVSSSVPSVPAGQNEYTENVSITYEIQ